jgi:hypothetical protein
MEDTQLYTALQTDIIHILYICISHRVRGRRAVIKGARFGTCAQANTDDIGSHNVGASSQVPPF